MRRRRHFILGAKPASAGSNSANMPLYCGYPSAREKRSPAKSLPRPQGGENGGERKEKFPHSPQFPLRYSECGTGPIFLRLLGGLFFVAGPISFRRPPGSLPGPPFCEGAAGGAEGAAGAGPGGTERPQRGRGCWGEGDGREGKGCDLGGVRREEPL